jgi:hypothetical protein
LLGGDESSLAKGAPLASALRATGWSEAAAVDAASFGESHEAVPALQLVQLLDRVAVAGRGRWLVLLPSPRTVAFLALACP